MWFSDRIQSVVAATRKMAMYLVASFRVLFTIVVQLHYLQIS